MFNSGIILELSRFKSQSCVEIKKIDTFWLWICVCLQFTKQNVWFGWCIL